MSEAKDLVFVADRVTLLAFRPLGAKCVSLEEATESADPQWRRDFFFFHCESAKMVVVSHEARLELAEDLDAVTNPHGLPLVVAIPGALGSKGDRGARIRKLVERAMGADLFKDD